MRLVRVIGRHTGVIYILILFATALVIGGLLAQLQLETPRLVHRPCERGEERGLPL